MRGTIIGLSTDSFLEWPEDGEDRVGELDRLLDLLTDVFDAATDGC